MIDADIPSWAQDIHDLNDYILKGHGISTNLPQAGSRGENVHIGVIDSACRLPDGLTNGHDVNQGPQNSFISEDDDDTTGHCHHVFSVLSFFAPDSTFSIYQAVNSESKLTLGAYADAISMALDDGVDILNISAGDPWRGPIHLNPNVSETKRLTEAGITTVAAAGNYDSESDDKRPPVHCPSAKEEVISVAALVSDCPHERGEESSDGPEGPYYCVPDEDKLHPDINPILGTFCGNQGCIDGNSCITTQENRPSIFNPLPTGNKPDVLAPMHIIDVDPNGVSFLAGGSSFSVPIVSASLACIYSELRNQGKFIPDPSEARRAVRRGRRLIDSQIVKYDAIDVRKALGVI